MKIKAVCEATGLTDRSIRYYIEEALISPVYTENYLGRKTFDFSEADIRQLKDIAVLRKFGFSIAEIREMQLYPEHIPKIAQELQNRKQGTINEEQNLLAALSRLDKTHPYTVSELAALLSEPVEETKSPVEDSHVKLSCLLLSFVKKVVVFFITWAPVALAAKAVFDYYRWYRYPVIRGREILMLVLLLLPTLLILLVSRLKYSPRFKRILITVLLILSVVLTPFQYMVTSFHFCISETTDPFDYRVFDSNSHVNRDGFAQALLPVKPLYSGMDAYRYFYEETVYGNTCEIYAQWSPDAESFAAELVRVQALYDAPPPTETGIEGCTFQKGSYTCHILYSGTPPFEAATKDSTYYICFCYDQHTLTVRYIYFYTDIGTQPSYLSLDW